MKCLCALILMALLGASSFCSYAQAPAPLVSGNFQGLSVEAFVRRIEAQTSYRFFFD